MRLENCVLTVIETGTEASFRARSEKLPQLYTLRRQTEVAKRLVRISNELNIIKLSRYLELSADLQEISKMANGWIKSLTESPD